MHLVGDAWRFHGECSQFEIVPIGFLILPAGVSFGGFLSEDFGILSAFRA
jgi:hypothetical protein